MTSPFQRMSIDLIDFSNKPSMGNFRYIFVAIDNYSRFLVTKALKNKTPANTAKAMKEVIDEVKKYFDRKISHVLADRGSEFQGEFREVGKLNLCRFFFYFIGDFDHLIPLTPITQIKG